MLCVELLRYGIVLMACTVASILSASAPAAVMGMNQVITAKIRYLQINTDSLVQRIPTQFKSFLKLMELASSNANEFHTRENDSELPPALRNLGLELLETLYWLEMLKSWRWSKDNSMFDSCTY